VTEPSVASGVGCLNLASRQWDTDILNALISPALFPSVVESTAIAGRLKSEIAAVWDCLLDYLVAGGSDSAAAAISLSISSSNLNRGRYRHIRSHPYTYAHPIPDPEGRVHLFSHVDGGYYLLGVTLAAGGSALVSRYICAESFLHRANGRQSLATRCGGVLFYTYQENAVHTRSRYSWCLG